MERFKWFTNILCEFYPCHSNIAQINCLFCYCPLYTLDDCGGDYDYTILDDGKDCSGCIFPHDIDHGWNEVMDGLSPVIKIN